MILKLDKKKNLSREYGVPVEAVEFVNEPNMFQNTGFPKDYTAADLLDGCTEKLDVFSYHYYNGVSERMAAMMPSAFIPAEGAMSEEYLGMAGFCASCFALYRDKYSSGCTCICTFT